MKTDDSNGTVSEYLAAADFSSKGWDVSIPGNSAIPYDMIIHKAGVSLRVQVKTGYVQREDCGTIRAKLQRVGRRLYTKDDFDILAVVHDGYVYLFDNNVIEDRGCISFKPETYDYRSVRTEGLGTEARVLYRGSARHTGWQGQI